MNTKALLLFVLFFFPVKMKAPNGEDIVKMMYKKYAGKWARTLVFDQTTEIYRDTTKRVQTWHEWMSFPDKLRIDMEPIANGTTTIYRGDSTYSFRQGKLANTSPNGNDLIFLLGGMYFYPQEKTIEKFTKMGYDLSKTGEDKYNGHDVYILGATSKDEKSNQLWVNKDDMYVVRMLRYDKNAQGTVNKQDAQFENYIKLGGGGAETRVMFYINDKLRQAEIYFNCHEDAKMDMKIFDPQHYMPISYASH